LKQKKRKDKVNCFEKTRESTLGWMKNLLREKLREKIKVLIRKKKNKKA